jgi:hypothetical protein
MTEDQRLEAAGWIISNEGKERFYAWERLMMEYPLRGVVPHTFASKMTWCDAKEIIRRRYPAEKMDNEAEYF